MVLYGKKPSNRALREIIEIPRNKILGLGWPIGKGGKVPFFNKSSSIELIRSQVYQIIRTKKWERVFLPEFGIDIDKYLFDSLDSYYVANLTNEIRRSLSVYAPNIKLLSLRVFQDDNIKGYGMPGLLINLKVAPKRTNESIDVEIVV